MLTSKPCSRELTSFLYKSNPPSRVIKALSRLRNAMRARNWGPDVVMKAIHDIDTAFFNSRLRGKIVVNWSDAGELRKVGRDMADVWGCTTGDTHRRCTVFLNADQLFAAPDIFQRIWQTLFHELVVSDPNYFKLF